MGGIRLFLKIFLGGIALSLTFLLGSCQSNADQKKSTGDATIEQKIAELVGSMTLEEKVGQMTQVTLDVLTKGENPLSSYEPVELDSEIMKKAFGKYKIGSVLNTANNRARSTVEWNKLIAEIQDFALENSRLKIPVLYGLDMIHGASYVAGATFFPQQIGMAATWNPDLLTKAGEVTAYETRAAGVAWTFSPVLDLGLDPRWPRQWETFGEDPYLASVMGHHLIKGLQGDANNISDPTHIAACLKHFLGYSQPLSGKDRTPAWIPENMLREYHLPSFRKGIEAGVMTVMVNSGEINGTPVHGNAALLTDLLKNELHFDGLVVTDWSDIEFLHTRHKVAASHKEAVKMAINAGIDMSMVPYNFDFADHLIALVNEGEVAMSRINDAVTRILRVKMMLGLFEKPVTYLTDYPLFGSDEFAEAALKTAEESITLLKNNNQTLPLPRSSKILVAGPAANSMRPLNGGWSYSWQGNLTDEFAQSYQTFFEAIQAKSGRAENVECFEGVRYDNKNDYRAELLDDLDLFKRKASAADVIVLCLGENSYTEKPGDLEDLYLSEKQQKLAEIAWASGKAVIIVLAEGRPRLISKIEPMASAIIQTYLPGNYGGTALAAILFGEINPSGKLPYTYPRYPNSLEPYFIKSAEQFESADSPAAPQHNPQYHFGFGLSYSTFEYLSLSTDKKHYSANDIIQLTVNIRNNSVLDGKETIHIFSNDHYASVTPSVKRLRAFKKILIKSSEIQSVTFKIPVSDLAFVDAVNKTVLEAGSFSLMSGGLSATISISP